ncbi:MAG: hypothetical protein JNJ99_16640 [Crocinitomicaceae bacterium]|nr:hypothetical protein [Crocinitomicaceae bacterium]
MKRIKKSLLFLAVAVSLWSCKHEIVDFFEAIQDYGYRTVQPLGQKSIPVNDAILGGYVYEGLPVIISKKDQLTYEIKFLSVLLHKEDAIIEAHTTQIAGVTYFNLAMGNYYCIMQANLIMNKQLEIKLMKEAFKDFVSEKELKSWLEKNPGVEEHWYTENGSEWNLIIYFSFVFEKVTIDEALRIQKLKLTEARKNLFENCETYIEFEELKKRYPNDEFTILAVESLLENCATIEELNAFIAYFPQYPDMIVKAKESISFIIETYRQEEFRAKDEKSFETAKKLNSIDGYTAFRDSCYTRAYKDSAEIRIADLASKINIEDVEWKWTNGDQLQAMNLLFYKIDYLKDISEATWIIEKITLYTLRLNDAELSKKVLGYFDKLVEKRVGYDDFLLLCIGKGFILWSVGDMENALQTFELKLGIYCDSCGMTVKEKIKSDYEFYVENGISFPNQKENWKKIKKLKPEK